MERLKSVIFILMLFAVSVSVAYADIGDGELVSYSPEVIVEMESEDIVVTIHNDNPADVANPICIDEIIITAPSDWTGTANLESVSNLGAVTVSNQADDGTYSGLISDNQSIRIIPDYADDGVELCPSGTTEIRISGLYAPDASEGGELSDFMILTSDMMSNEPSDNNVRYPIDNDASCGAKDDEDCSFSIRVTEATGIKIEYLQFTDIDSNVGDAEYQITAKAWGGWGRLTEIYVDASSSMTVDVYLEKAGSGFQTSDYLIANNVALSPGFNTITLSYTSGVDVVGNIKDGYIKDSEQGGSDALFYIDRVSGSGTLDFLGHADEDADESIDPTYAGTGFTNPPKEGTIIGVESSIERAFKVQLVREEGGKYLDVHEEGIPIHFSSSLGILDVIDTETTDALGEVENHLNADDVAGNTNVEICMPESIGCTYEDVGINAGAPHHFRITKGTDGTEVQAGTHQEIEVTVYDQYGNVITNNPSRPMVDFAILDEPDREGLNDASLDDDTSPGPITKLDDEKANQGIADMYLFTSKVNGEHQIEVCVEGIGCENTSIFGVLGQAEAIECTLLNDSTITADECFDVLVQVVDRNDNPLPKWESMVEVSLEGLDAVNGQTKYIYDTDMREENPLLPDGMPISVMGKLNEQNGSIPYAWGIVEVCGCEAIGQFDVVCKSDTLEDDEVNLDVRNSEPMCIDVEVEGREDACDDHMQLHTSILDTCGNKLVDQECAEGGWATSCVELNTSCGEISTDKTCVDLRNTGQAPLVDLDISSCACGDITIEAYDENDCCASVYDGKLPQCDSTVINKVGPASYMSMSVRPDKSNQDDFWVSEETLVDLRLKDACDQQVFCESRTVDIELKGEDCSDDTLQVDSPYEAIGEELCYLDNEPVHKVVIENCKDADKVSGTKEWTDLPEQHDLVINKIAFEYNGNSTDVEACIYEETEESNGFQSGEDILWRCIDLDDVPTIPGGDTDSPGNEGAWDSIHDETARDGTGDIYFIELDNRISEYGSYNEYDIQRMGGAIVEPGDTKDFYIVLSSDGDVPCGTYDADYMYYQDYNSPDIISWSPRDTQTHVRDTIVSFERYTEYNDDYMYPDAYPDTTVTSEYGFGDRILHNLVLRNGQAQVSFRDLVAETVNIDIVTSLPIYLYDLGFPVVEADDANITFKTQPATQVVARNHGDQDEFICDDAGFEPKYEYDRNFGGDGQPMYMSAERDCRPAMACGDEGYDVNLQVTDGFQNPVGLETEVQLHSCLTYPHYIYLGDTLLDIDENITVDLWDYLERVHPDIHYTSEPRDVCFDMDVFGEALQMILEDHLGPHNQYSETFIDSPEFLEFVHSIVDDKQVKFVEQPGYPIYEDKAGNLVVKTDSDGRAKVRVESNESSLFQIKSFDSSFRIFFQPHALDADYFDVAFAPGKPKVWDVMAWPNVGIPADGEQESMLLLRKLDACGNPVAVTESAKVSLMSDSGRAIISKDFDGNNNYDDSVTGMLSQDSCMFMFPWFEDCGLEVLNDVMENVTVVVEDENCVGTEGYCTGFPGCSAFTNMSDCMINECIWEQTGEDCQTPGYTEIEFVGAPVQLKITEIRHSDLIPADGWRYVQDFDLPADACTEDDVDFFDLIHNEPEICTKDCVEYGNTGGWVTVEIQDKYGSRVTSYLGDGLKDDPGDAYGSPDYVAEKVCVALDDERAFIQDYAMGWRDLDLVSISDTASIYCGDLVYGKGAFKVAYSMLDEDGQPLDPKQTEKVVVSVFDVCDRNLFERYAPSNTREMLFDDLCNAQEYNENNLPDSETASRLDPDSNKMIFTSVPDRWDIEADKLTVSADGEDYAEVMINTENEYMDVRTSLDATVQSSLLGSKLESEYINEDCYVEGTYDSVNPTSINVITEDCSGGRAKLKLYSEEPGTARLTVTGNGFGCKEYLTGDEYTTWFEETVNEGYLNGSWFGTYVENCTSESNISGTESFCQAFAEFSYNEVWDYYQLTETESATALTELYTPYCEEWGVIPLEPKTIEVEFKQAFQESIDLEAGWNYFSVPQELDPSADSWSELGLDSVCDASAYYDESIQSFVAPIPAGTVVEPMEGYWCHVQEGTTVPVESLDVSGVYLPPTKHIYQGWNDVALSSRVEMVMEHALISIDDSFTHILDWVESLQSYVSYANTGENGGGEVPGTTGQGSMEAGEAYFIWAVEEDDLAGQS